MLMKLQILVNLNILKWNSVHETASVNKDNNLRNARRWQWWAHKINEYKNGKSQRRGEIKYEFWINNIYLWLVIIIFKLKWNVEFYNKLLLDGRACISCFILILFFFSIECKKDRLDTRIWFSMPSNTLIIKNFDCRFFFCLFDLVRLSQWGNYNVLFHNSLSQNWHFSVCCCPIEKVKAIILLTKRSICPCPLQPIWATNHEYFWII